MPIAKRRLSIDLQNSIRRFSYKNLDEFFQRYHKDMNVSRTTFYKAMKNEEVREEIVERIEMLCRGLGMLNDNGSSDYDYRTALLSDFLGKVGILCEDPSMSNLDALRVFFNNYGKTLRGWLIK